MIATVPPPIELVPLPLEERVMIRVLSPEESARRVLTSTQKLVFGLLVVALIATIGLFTRPALIGLLALVNISYLAISIYKLRTAICAFRVPDQEADALASIPDVALPIYTILVPLYHEAAVIPHLIRALERLDYPAAKLDVKLLLEPGDFETIAAVRTLDLPAHIETLIVPAGAPTGKPRACNYGLERARGELVTIYDAEDRPEPDQLRRVVAAFAAADPRLACVQCKLNFYNPAQNLLTRHFTSEYSMWFDLALPGLVKRAAPIPLGGTSNHFPTARLAELGGWDAWNVTEDADLGMRLARRGYATSVIDSTTWEEANSSLPNWIRQRSRWIKGYAQTWLVQMRHPLDLGRAVGFRGFIGFQAFVGGGFLLPLLNPLFWALTIVWYLTRATAIESHFPTWLFLLSSVNFLLGNFAFVYACMLGAVRRGYFGLVKFTLLMPLYWALMSVAAWRGVLQLIGRASYWEKTTHGLWPAATLDEPVRLPAHSGGSD